MRLMIYDIEKAFEVIRKYARKNKAIPYINSVGIYSIYFLLKMREGEFNYVIYFQDYKIRDAGE